MRPCQYLTDAVFLAVYGWKALRRALHQNGLGFGARWLAPLFAKPRAWQLLDILIGLTMWTLSGMLVLRLVDTMEL